MEDSTMPSNLAATMSGLNNHYDQDESSHSLLSRRGSSLYYSSRYLHLDGTGFYLSSLAVTIFISVVATIGILLFTLIITLSILISSCQKKPDVVIRRNLPAAETIDLCRSFMLNFELNNLHGSGALPPSACNGHLLHYMKDGQYEKDVKGAVAAADAYWTSVLPSADGLDTIIIDVDETAVSNWPYYRAFWPRSQVKNDSEWIDWIKRAESPPLVPMLQLYQKLQTKGFSLVFLTSRHEKFRGCTKMNLLRANYSGWRKLIMRSDDDFDKKTQMFKTDKRLQLEKQGFRIHGVIGDQWTDILGPSSGNYTIKIPNPLYHVM